MFVQDPSEWLHSITPSEHRDALQSRSRGYLVHARRDKSVLSGQGLKLHSEAIHRVVSFGNGAVKLRLVSQPIIRARSEEVLSLTAMH